MKIDKFIKKPEGKKIITTMDEFFNGMPSEYGINYYKNLESVNFSYVMSIYGRLYGQYIARTNTIYYISYESIPHELFHMASYDKSKDMLGFDGYNGEISLLNEGLTEYLYNRAFGIEVSDFRPFEVMCANMIIDIPGVLKNHFNPNYEGFINSFNDRDTIESLIDELDVYGEANGYLLDIIKMDGGNARFNKQALIDIRDSINNIIRFLIMIGLDNKDKININEYIEKMIKLLNKDNIAKYFKIFYSEYMDDTKEVIRKLVK